jgi:Pentapeptide repeats (9 copies)
VPVEDQYVDPRQRCHEDGCEAVQLADLDRCLEHASSEAFEGYVAMLAPGASIDLRSTRVPRERLDVMIAALDRMLGAASFQNASFPGGANFEACDFRDEVSFAGAILKRAYFNKATFRDLVDFDYAELSVTYFENASFWRKASFHRAKFDTVPRLFFRTVFESAVFSEATFEDAVGMGPLRADVLDLAGSVFVSRIVIEASAVRVSAIRVEFREGVAFQLRYAELALDRALLGPGPSVSAAPPFLYHSEYDGLVLAFDESPVEGAGLDPRPRLLSVRHADVSGLAVTDVDLSSCLFADARNLDKIRIEGARPFMGTPSGLQTPVRRWARRQTLAEENIWREIQHHLIWIRAGKSPHRNLYAYLQSFKGPRYADLADRSWIHRELGEERHVVEPSRIGTIYRALRKSLEDAKNEPGAADFYYGEMEMRRFDRESARGERLILFFYWLTSGYGLRGSRALASLCVLILVVSTMFNSVGFRGDHSSFVSGLIFTAQATLSIEDRSVPLTMWGGVFLIVLRLTGPLFLGLALLSVRNRVKR